MPAPVKPLFRPEALRPSGPAGGCSSNRATECSDFTAGRWM